MTKSAVIDSLEVAELPALHQIPKQRVVLLDLGEPSRVQKEADISCVLSNVKHVHSNRGFKTNISKDFLQIQL